MALFKLNATLVFMLLITTLEFVSSDFTKDQAECENDLITLSSCLNYVAGEAKAPTPLCCTVLYKEINVTKRCLCIIVKDRDEPRLGLKLNATRALSLPTLCHAASNALECIALLGLNPKSPEAQIFIQSANSTRAEDNAPLNSSSDGVKKIWVEMGSNSMLLWCLVMVLLVNF